MRNLLSGLQARPLLCMALATLCNLAVAVTGRFVCISERQTAGLDATEMRAVQSCDGKPETEAVSVVPLFGKNAL